MNYDEEEVLDDSSFSPEEESLDEHFDDESFNEGNDGFRFDDEEPEAL